MKIITTIHAYNFHLFISYLGGGVKIIPFTDSRKSFNHTHSSYLKEVNTSNSLQEITTSGHLLLGVSNTKISSVPLRIQDSNKVNYDFWDEFNTSQLSVDSEKKELFILSESTGIEELNIRDPFNPRKKKNTIPKAFEQLGEPAVSNMVTRDNFIFLAIRGYGVSKLSSEFSNLDFTFRTTDAQDVNYIKEIDTTIVADAFEGILLFSKIDKKPHKKFSLPNSDFPQQISLLYNKILIKGKKGLYLYDLNYSKLYMIWEGTTGAVTHYFDNIIFSSKGQIHLISLNDKGLNSFKLNHEHSIDIKKVHLNNSRFI